MCEYLYAIITCKRRDYIMREPICRESLRGIISIAGREFCADVCLTVKLFLFPFCAKCSIIYHITLGGEASCPK